MQKTRILSGVQSTGKIHLGNYIGAIKNWIDLQNHHECFFFLADLHAITVDQDPKELYDSTLSLTATYLACGIDVNKSIIFAQSDVKQHSELAWILNCMTPVGWLKRMTQFKDKAGKNQDVASSGLFTYPVLMAADILLYNPDFIPVGEDQKQHIEITRDIAGAVNRKFNDEVFKCPEPMIAKSGFRIKSLKDGTKKMSKSDPSDASRINLSDNIDIMRSKIMKAKTDSLDFISYDPESRPEISNLLEIFSIISEKNIHSLVSEYENSGNAKFKAALADALITKFEPIINDFNNYMSNKEYIIDTLKKGKEKASIEAEKTISKVKQLFGFINN